jgi:hypothetical protein
MSDSLIRLRQLNQLELSGYVSRIIPNVLIDSGIRLSGESLAPTGSGVCNLGAPSYPFQHIYTNDLVIPSGSGIHFGQLLFTAYYSGGGAVLQFGDYTIISSSVGLSIIGPSGERGFSGASGASGASGIGISGTLKSGSFLFRWPI